MKDRKYRLPQPVFFLVVFLMIASLICLTFLTTRNAPPIVWVVPSLVRVGQFDPPGGSARADLFAARGECESFQVVVHAPSRKLTNIMVTVADLVASDGRLIPISSLELYREHYVQVVRGSEDRGGTNRPRGSGWYPDGLIPIVDPASQQPGDRITLKAIPVNLEAGRNQPFWVDVCIPRQTTPGQYRGVLTVTSDQGLAAVSILVHVWNFELPLKPSLQTAFTIYNDRISQPPVFYAVQRANQEMLLRHKIMPVPVNHQDEREFIDELGLNIGHLAFYQFATWGNCDQPPAPSVAELRSQRARRQPDIPIFIQIADEVSDCTKTFPTLREWARNARSAGILTLLTAVPIKPLLDDGSGTGRSVADIWVLLPKQFVSHAGEVEAVLRRKDQVWSYTALVQDEYSPKWAIDFDPINYRILGGFLNQSHGLQGLLYWAVNSWVLEAHNDPWKRILNLGPNRSFPPGEGMLVYPGDKVGLPTFAPSMRLKWIRDSVEDFEYVEILKRLNREEWALQVVRTVAVDWKNWTHDPASLEAVRLKLGEEIDRLSRQRATRP